METKAIEQGQEERSGGARASIGLAFLAFIMIGANDGAFGVILPSVRAHYGVDNAILGTIFLCSTLGYFIGTFNNGLLLGKMGMQRFLILGGIITLLAMTTYSLAPPFPVLLGAALILGLGIALIDAGLNSYIASLPQNTKLLNYLHAFYGAGAWLGPFVASSLLALQWGWNYIYMLWGALSLIVIGGAFISFKGVHQGKEDREETKKQGNVLGQVLRMRLIWLAALFLLFYVGNEVMLGSWGFSFLTEERHGPELLSGWVMSGYWLALTIGRIALARVGQAVGNKRLIEMCLAGTMLGLLLIWWGPTPWLTAGGFWIVGFCLGPMFPTAIALLSTLVSGRVLPTAIGFLASLGSMGAALFPWLAGNIIQHIGLWALLPLAIVLALAMLGMWIPLMRGQKASA